MVLLVDTSSLFVHHIRRLLNVHAHDEIVVVTAAKFGPHGALVGVGMSARCQFRLLPQLRAILPRAGIIGLGSVEEGYREAALTAGADLFPPGMTWL